MLTKLPYGLKNGVLTFVQDVEQGLACDCVCPECGEKLIARKGKLNIHHFAHYKEGDCKGGIETALHLAAKEIIQKEKKLMLPPLKADIPNQHTETILLQAEMIAFDEVEVEKKINDIKPDLILHKGNKKLLIEIAVTHFVDDIKTEKIKQLGLSTLEIDLSSIKDGFTTEDLAFSLIHSTDNRQWIYNAKEIELTHKYLQTKKEKEQARKIKLAAQKKIRQQKIQNTRKYGYDVILPDENHNLYCPMKIHQTANKCKNNSIIQQIQDGKQWNGTIYGWGSKGKYIYLDNIRTEIYPEGKEAGLTKEEYEKRHKIHGQLSYIRSQSPTDYKTCEACKYFGEYMENHFSSFSCKYRKEHK